MDKYKATNICSDWRGVGIDTFTVILCSGDGLFSQAIKIHARVNGAAAPAAQITHVAMVVCIRGKLYVFESTLANKWCGKTGIQINPFEEWLRRYNGRVWVRNRIPDKYYLLEIARPKFRQVRMDMYGLPYESGVEGIVELIGSGMKTDGVVTRTAEVHCSEANVIVDQRCRFYDKRINPAKMPPYTFWLGGKWEKHLLNCSAGKPKLIKE